MNLDGSLRGFAAVPPEHEAAPTYAKSPDWAPLFAAASLDPAKFTSVTPEWSSSVMTDSRAAWTGMYRERTFQSGLKPHRFTTALSISRFYGPG